MKRLGYLGIDQYGQHYEIDKYPRKELLAKLGAARADKIYCDSRGGKMPHVGYLISGLWIDVYQVYPFKEAA